MKLVLSGLLLASLCDSSGTLRVTQSPDVSVQEGGMVNISCCWTGGFQQVRVSIKMKPTNMKNNTNSIILSKEIHEADLNNCSNLIIKSASIEDSGIYICKLTVEIPTLTEIEGNGTVVTVTPKEGEEKEDGREGKLEIFSNLCNIILIITSPWSPCSSGRPSVTCCSSPLSSALCQWIY
uniref:Ig-like domain-containing protein n=1 Tax=Salarias fasciatus TaxID=181472 RepID=A0A672GTH6_SALFA